MNTRTNTCPCCGSSLLRHVRQQGIYWFCPSCYQEVPSLLSLVRHGCDTLKPQLRSLTAMES